MKLSMSREMKELDKRSIEEFKIPDIVLMENAAKGSFNVLEKEFGSLMDKKISIFAGLGNNGGDALALARHLYNANAKIAVYMFSKEEKLNPSPKINYQILESLNVPLVFVENIADINDTFLAHSDIVIDGLFGIGLSRNIEGLFYEVIEKINKSNVFKLALDIPSGINADTGECMGIALRADLCVTFGLAKPGHFLYPGRNYCGKLEIVDISTPKILIDEFNASFRALTKNDFYIPKRPKESHKGNFGHVALVGGSTGKSGAVILASLASLKSGSGLVSAVIPYSINGAFESALFEAMSYPILDENGFFSKQGIEKIINFVKDKDVICFGMGLGNFDGAFDLLKALIELKKPMVIDADGLNVLSQNTDILKLVKSPVVLTPHPKEFSRLVNQNTPYVIKNRLNLIKDFANFYKLTLILKMADTLISDGDKIFINTTGNPGLSTGGSGDVLSGIIASFLGQGYSTIESAKLGVFVHGFSADLAVSEIGENALLPSDVVNYLPKALLSLG